MVGARNRFGRLFVLAALLASACGGQPAQSGSTGSGEAGEQRYPDVVEAELAPEGEGTWSLNVTISSPYDSPERYAGGWRVLAADGTVLGEHELTHDHASEQPFTRTQSGLEIPVDVAEVTVEGRDTENGYGGKTVTIPTDRG